MTNSSIAQVQTEAQRIQEIENQLEEFSKKHKALKESVEISVSTDLRELVRTLAENHKVNITIDNNANQPFSNSLPDVTVRELLVFICKTYSLELDFTGSIITIKKYNAPPKRKATPKRKEPKVTYNKFNDKLSVTANNDTLFVLLRKITELSGINLAAEPSIRNKLIGAGVTKADFEKGLNEIAFENGLEVEQSANDFFTFTAIKPNNQKQANGSRRNGTNKGNKNQANQPLNYVLAASPTSKDSIQKISADNQPIKDLIKQTSAQLEKDFFFLSEPTGNATLQLQNVTYEEFLEVVLKGTKFNYSQQNGAYFIGGNQQEGLRKTTVAQLQYRSYETVETLIPKQLKSADVEILPYPEMNSFVISGPSQSVDELERYLAEIDRPVPNVSIELIILDVQKSTFTEIGIDAGVGTEPPTSGGTLFPAIDFSLSTQSINDLISVLSGQGLINIGQVNSNFYLSLKAIEENGIAKIKSQPQLATLSSHEANFTIGETRYYRNENSNVTPGITPVINNNVQFESLEANFTVKITPVVSGDEQVTLAIVVEQSDFIGEIQDNAPSPQVTRTFDSNIRIKNGEMIVLGGLERKQTNETRNGVPFLSRIPVIKWFFSNRKKTKTDSKLLIFVKPVIQF
jgi:type IV pilus assembly protein PilQ